MIAETLATFVTLASIQLVLKAACQGVGRELSNTGSDDDGPET